ncbi:hypothetical protein [Streptomyces sp. NPDC055400]
MVVGEAASAVVQAVTELLGGHRAWERFTPAL